MAMRRILTIYNNPEDEIGDFFDLWEVKSIKREERYNENTNSMEYLIIINRDAIATNFNDSEIVCNDREWRDQEMARIKQILDDDDTIIVL